MNAVVPNIVKVENLQKKAGKPALKYTREKYLDTCIEPMELTK